MSQNMFDPNPYQPSVINQITPPIKSRVGLATLGGFQPPSQVMTTNIWAVARLGGRREPNSFPPPINEINWQGFHTKEVSGYSQKLYWVCGYGILPSNTSGAPMMIMCQWWHTEAVSITDFRVLSSEDWDNANIYIAPMERLEDAFLAAQLSTFNGVNSTAHQSPQTEYVDVIEFPTVTKPEEEPTI